MPIPQLSLGSYGHEVKLLHQQLRRLGFNVGSSEVARSLFGPSTRAALERWQRRHGLKVTGVLDPSAYVVLMSARAASARHTGSTENIHSVLAIPSPRNGNGSRTSVPVLMGVARHTRQQQDVVSWDPTVTLQITSPPNNDPLLGMGPTPQSILGTMDVTTAGGTYNWISKAVTVTIGNSPPQAAYFTSGSLDVMAGGQLKWEYDGTLPGGTTPIQVSAEATLVWQDDVGDGTSVGNVTKVKATPITIQYNSNVIIDVQSPQDGQVLPCQNPQNGITITATGTASSQAPLDHLDFSLDGNLWTSITPLTSPWSIPSIPLTLGPHTLLFTAYDTNGRSQSEQLTVQVSLAEDIFSVDVLSYLRALVEFATWPFNTSTARITTDSSQSQNVTLDLIDQSFYRSIALILDPINKGKATETVRAVRVCIEILRKYIWFNYPSDMQVQRLAKEQGKYNAAVYRLLLNGVGTSYEELRMARMYDRTSAQDIRKLGVLTDRLGIHLRGVRPDELDQLFFDIGASPGSAGALSESALEQLFGFQDTTRDPFSQGTTVGDTQGLIQRWVLRGMSWNVTTDADGLAYLSIERQAGFVYAVVCKDSACRFPLAGGPVTDQTGAAGPNASGIAELQPLNNSGVSGQIEFNPASTSPALPYSVSLSVFPRLLSWQRQRLRADWAVEDALLHTGPVLVDPMGQITKWKISGVTLSTNNDGNGFLYLNITMVPGPSYQIDLYSDSARTARIATGSSSTPKATITLTEVSGSGVSGSVTLNYQNDTSAIILAMVVNRGPAVDPDLLADGDFVSRQSDAYKLFTTRSQTISTWLNDLKTMREAASNQDTGLESILSTVLIDPQYYPNGMKSADVQALDSNRKAGADISGVLTALFLDLAAFNYLVQVCAFLNSAPPPPPLPTPQLLESEWEDVYSILAQVQKRRAAFAWVAEEKARGVILSPDSFSFPPSLPTLFATGVGEDGQPLADGAVDPHWSIVATPNGPAAANAYATVNAASGYPIGQAWLRNNAASRWISPQADESTGDAPGFYLYQTKIDIGRYDPKSVWLVLQVAVDNVLFGVLLNGTPVRVSAVGFSRFSSVEITGPFQSGINTLKLIVQNEGSQPNPSGLRVEISFGGPPVISSLPAWRATTAARSDWETVLQARFNEDAALESSLQSVLDETERQMLPDLRDALLAAASIQSVIPNLYSTGANTQTSSGGTYDSDWRINMQEYALTAWVTTPNAAWLPNGGGSQWIAPSADENSGMGDPAGIYIYRTTFDLINVDLSSVKLGLWVLVDQSVVDVFLNMQSLGLKATGFTTPTPMWLTSGFVAGTNTLAIVVSNGAVSHPSGLRVAAAGWMSTFVDADWLSTSLLLDVKASSDRLTTRLDNATQMMQSLYFALRNNEFEHLSPPPSAASWTLTEAPYTFDQEWVTMSSYDSWNALMQIFLYPENLLLPDLRTLAQGDGQPHAISQKTQEFARFVSDLQSASPLTPAAAVTIANKYAANLLAAGYANLPAELVGVDPYADPRGIDLTAMAGYYNSGDWVKVAFLWEAWYSVAVQIGLELQKAQQFEAALGWFGCLYGYTTPLVQNAAGWSDDNRKYFPGLLYGDVPSSSWPALNNLNQYLQVPTWTITSPTPHEIATTRAHPYARFMNLTIIRCLLDFADAQFTVYTPESVSEAQALYQQAIDLLSDLDAIWPADPFVARNPQLRVLRSRAETNLAKLEGGRNIAGMLTPQPGSSGSLQPSAYRYSALIDRAKQIVTLAQQTESAYLSAMEKGANEAYTALNAQQDLESANAAVKLESLKVTEANAQVSLADEQANKSTIEVKQITDLLDSDIVDLERDSVGMQWVQVGLSLVSGFAVPAAGGGSSSGGKSGGGSSSGGGSGGGSAFGAAASALNSQASLEEKQIDWQAQKEQAYNDQNIAQSQIALAQDGVAVATQDLANANLQAKHASNVVSFLANKFTNVQLYQWMSGVLGSIYSYFLRQATAIARLAENQLAFERQEKAPSVIQSDYWSPLDPNATPVTNTNGLTGAERLLADITQLDQYSLDTDKFKLQLTKTISLARLDPVAFQQFTQTGVLRFRTPMDMFDRDFPGHYLRMIKQVRMSVVAIIPPNDGIRASLSNPGISRVMVAGDSGDYRSVVVRRDPQLIALSSPTNANGIFDLTAQPTMLLPFEDLGVDTSWEFIMPRAANQLDFSTIADVLLTIDYTALDSRDYRHEVIQQLDQNISADRAYSFRQQFADAWYDLNNPDQSLTPMVVEFQTGLADFPPNMENLTIQQLVMYFVPANGSDLPAQPKATLTFTGTDSYGNPESPSGTEIAVANIISTRRTDNLTGWSQMIGMQVSGGWKLDLSDPNTSRLFQNCQLQDILFVITYSGRLPDWPT